MLLLLSDGEGVPYPICSAGGCGGSINSDGQLSGSSAAVELVINVVPYVIEEHSSEFCPALCSGVSGDISPLRPGPVLSEVEK